MTPVLIITPSDIFGIFILSIIFIVASAVIVRDLLRKAFCKHDSGVTETSACNAICKKCGKNLGFIGNYRDKK